jgi:hypothetical protein
MSVGICRPRSSGPVSLCALVAALALALLLPVAASAHFVRPFVRQITGTPTGQEGAIVPFGGPDSLAVDGEDNLWVGESSTLEELGPSGAFVGSLPIQGSKSIAISHSTGAFYTVEQELSNAPGGNPYPVGIFSRTDVSLGHIYYDGNEAPGFVAVDNSTDPLDPSAGDLYVLGHYRIEGHQPHEAIFRYSATGSPESFETSGNASLEEVEARQGQCSERPSCFAIVGNEIIFAHGGTAGEEVRALAVDPVDGDIWVGLERNLLELTPAGELVREIPAENEAPGLPHGEEAHGFYEAKVEDLAVDPTDGDLLVSLNGSVHVGKSEVEEGVVDEFNSEGVSLGQLNEAAGQTLSSARALAFDSHGDLFVANDARGSGGGSTHAVEEFGPGRFDPTLSPAAATQRSLSGAVLNGSVDPESKRNPEGAGITDCHFEYVSEAGFKTNDVNELQSITLGGASGGTFALGLEGRSLAASGTGDLAGPAEGTGTLVEGVDAVFESTATKGAFAVGDEISGEGIPAGTTIVAVQPGVLVLSAGATASGGSVALSAASDEVTSLSTTAGTFAAGEEIAGAGIPAGTTIVKVRAGGRLVLSTEVTAAGSGVALSAGLAYNASAEQVQSALEGLSSIGPGNVTVSGGAGGPYTVQFKGAPLGLADTAVPQLTAESAGLTPAGASVTAAIEREGGDGWGTAKSVPCEHPDAGEIPKSEAETPVHAQVSEPLEAGATYRYRVSATVGGALGGSAHSAATAFTIPHAPRISGTAVSDVTSAFATLSAEVDPLGGSTTYQFQYLTEEQLKRDGGSWAGAMVAPASPVALGSGGEAGDLAEGVSQQIGSLQPETAYRFRVLAANEAGTTEGEAAAGGGEVAHVFTTQPAAAPALPDGRAYELLTPPDKNGGEDLFRNGGLTSISIDQGVSSESGDQFLLETRVAFGPFPGSGHDAYVFSRHPVAGHPERDEWGYTSLASPALGVQNMFTSVAEPNLSRVAFRDNVGSPDNEAGAVPTTLLGPPGGPYTTVWADQPTHLTGGEEATHAVGGSRDLGVVVLSSDNPVLAEGGHCEHGVCGESGLLIPHLYEWADGESSPLEVQSDGAPIGPCGAALGNGEQHGAWEGVLSGDGAVSADGSKIFFTAPDPNGPNGIKGCPTKGGENPPELYMRFGEEETAEVSAPEKGAPEYPRAHHPAVFIAAAEDGSRVFFLSEGELTANDAGIHDMELYEYETATGRLTRISAGDSGAAAGGVEPKRKSCYGIICGSTPDYVVSGDGSHVYFVATSVLAPRNAEGGEPREGAENVYVYDAQTGRTAFIVTLPVPQSGVSGSMQYQVPEATSDGRFLLFYGANGLDRYDAQTESLVCVTCSASAGPRVPSELSEVEHNDDLFNFGGLYPPSTVEAEAGVELLPPHSISEDGSYVFFNTKTPLVPQDTDGVMNVYEWHEGTISLLSSGQDSQPSFLLGASANGANVFIGTQSQLVPADSSGGGNVYDARICEPERGNPCIASAPAQEGLCEGDACSHPPVAPNDATPASLTFSGAGDLPPGPSTMSTTVKSCPKPKKLSHGRCVKAKSRKAESGKAKKSRKTSRKASARKARARKAGFKTGGGR